PSKERIIAELERDELKDMAFKLSCIINKKKSVIMEQHQQETGEEVDAALIIVYELLARFVRSLGIKPARKYKKQTPL
ncbi:hypothetical protein, partial [Vibrio anguillarum]